MRKLFGAAIIALGLAVAIAGCKSGSSPTSPSPGGGSGGGGTGGGGTGGGSTQTTTMTINASGVLTPNDITVAVGSRVTIINQHNRNHEMNSDPHPEHSDCPAINDVGFLSVGQTKTTGNLNTVRTCGIHDHNDPTNTSLIGRIRIQ
jgi:plastocyanin